MSYDDIRTATIIRYPYLWARKDRAGVAPVPPSSDG